MAEAHGNRTDARFRTGADSSGVPLRKLRAVARDDAAKSAIARGGADSGADWNDARKALISRLAEPLKRAVSREDAAVARALLAEIEHAIPGGEPIARRA